MYLPLVLRPPAVPGPGRELDLLEHRLIRWGVIDGERRAVYELFSRSAIHDEVLRRMSLKARRLSTPTCPGPASLRCCAGLVDGSSSAQA
jgi:hypothetical protein